MKGFKDYYPKDKRIQNYMFEVCRKIAERYGYSEVDGPILEPVEIYIKSGEEIPKQMYTLTDKSNRKLALRPEFTPTVARMIDNASLSKPIKWFSISRCLRYEQPQFGRQREFVQFNLDFLGTDSMKADAEVILTAIKIMQEFNLTKEDFYIRISNRKLVQDLFKNIGIKEQNFQDIYRLIDKKCKISNKVFELTLKDKGLSEKQINELEKLFEIKSLDQIKAKIKSKGLEELKELFSYLKDYGILDFCKLDLSIMRGFDYYTSTVFEVFDSSRKYRAIAGGGRYDKLAKNCPGVGYAFGDVVLEFYLKERNKLSNLKPNFVYIIPIKTLKESLKIAEQLRKKGLNISIDLLDKGISRNLDYANKQKIPYVIFIGPEELKKKKLKLRDMKTGKEKFLKIDKIIKLLKLLK